MPSGGLKTGGLSLVTRTVRVVWISFRLSEPGTWVRILHGPPLSFPAADFIAIHIDNRYASKFSC